MVCARDHVAFVCRPFGLHRKLEHVRAWGRLSGRKRGHGGHPSKVLGFRAHVRLHPDGTDQRCISGTLPYGLLNELLHYAHAKLVLPSNGTAAVFAILVTIYFWWENIKGIPESSEKALRIMYVTTVMVVLMLAWCSYTLWVRGAHLQPWPRLSNLVYSSDALGWLRHTSLPYTVGLIGILIGLGHSVLAMSGEETMAQVYREIEHPKLRNLEKAGFVIFV